MTAALHHHVHVFAEPTEREDPRNALLRAFEAQIQAMVDNDLEGPIRALVARLLPPPTPPAADLFTPPAPANVDDLEAVTPDEELALSALLADCRRFEKFKMSALSHDAVARMKARTEQRLEVAKMQRTPAATEAAQ